MDARTLTGTVARVVAGAGAGEGFTCQLALHPYANRVRDSFGPGGKRQTREPTPASSVLQKGFLQPLRNL